MQSHRFVNFTLVLYFYLVLFEGALRKWLLPGLSDALLLCRDPLAVVLLCALLCRFRRWFIPLILLSLAFVALLLIAWLVQVSSGSLVAGHPLVALFGLRSYTLHYPVVLAYAILLREDMFNHLIKASAVLAFPMGGLMMLQYFAPLDHWLNLAPGAQSEGQFIAAFGHVRPYGTFGFPNGPALYMPFAAGCLLYLAFISFRENRTVVILSGVGLAMAMAFSGSRALIVATLGVLLSGWGLAIFLRRGFYLWLAGAIAALAFLILLTCTTLGRDAFETFSERWRTAAVSEDRGSGVLAARVADMLFATGAEGGYSNTITAWGAGLGLGTNVGAALVSDGPGFLLPEYEVARVFTEIGWIPGSFFYAARLLLFVYILYIGLQLMRVGRLEFLVFSLSALYLLLIGQTAQPNAQGHLVLYTGLPLAWLHLHSFRMATFCGRRSLAGSFH